MNVGLLIPKAVNLGETVTVLMRAIGATQTLFTQASIASITRRTVNTTTGAIIESGVSVDIPSSIFDTPQTDEGWLTPSMGYNFRDRITPSQAGNIIIEYTFIDSAAHVTIGTALIAVQSLP